MIEGGVAKLTAGRLHAFTNECTHRIIGVRSCFGLVHPKHPVMRLRSDAILGPNHGSAHLSHFPYGHSREAWKSSHPRIETLSDIEHMINGILRPGADRPAIPLSDDPCGKIAPEERCQENQLLISSMRTGCIFVLNICAHFEVKFSGECEIQKTHNGCSGYCRNADGSSSMQQRNGMYHNLVR